MSAPPPPPPPPRPRPPLPARPLPPSRIPSERARRWAFWIYAVILFVGTHWPRLEVPSIGIERTDILIHICAFGLWTVLLICTAYLGAPGRPGSVARAGMVALVYAAIDEGSQAIPIVQRHAGFDDYAANAAGILLACLGALAIAAVIRRRARRPDRSAPAQ